MPKIDRQAIYERDGGLCRLCGQPVAFSEFEVDHDVPRGARGTSDPSNLQTAHRGCNVKKGQGSLGSSAAFPYSTITQAAAQVGASRLDILRMIRRGILRAPNLYHGGTRRIRQEELDRFLSERGS